MSKKKIIYKVGPPLRKYLQHYSRLAKLPVKYEDLLRYEMASPLLDKNGKDTLWEKVFFPQREMEELNLGLTRIYSMLKAGGDTSVMDHLYVERIDYCTFGNSNPFRIRIVNQFNDNYDYFYVKIADASRVYGLELEHILSPNRINYMVDDNTLIEEHIAGIPGDQFIKNWLHNKETNEIRLAKEFVKFNERCFVRLLGDMRSYNYVIDITPDFEEVQYRIRAIDFDQQCYEGRKSLYMPQFFKENKAFVDLCTEHLNAETVKQYQKEERSLIAKRLKSSRYRLKDMFDAMAVDQVSSQEKINELREQLNEHYNEDSFLGLINMGDVLKKNLRMVLRKHLK
jgi:hypothetical protein